MKAGSKTMNLRGTFVAGGGLEKLAACNKFETFLHKDQFYSIFEGGPLLEARLFGKFA